jgi:hypothetical protein
VCVHVPLVDERESGFQKLSTAFVYLHLHLRREFYVIPLSQCAKRSLASQCNFLAARRSFVSAPSKEVALLSRAATLLYCIARARAGDKRKRPNSS